MEKTKIIQNYCRQFNLGGIAQNFENVHNNAQKNRVSYLDYVLELLKTEADIRDAKNLERQLKVARLPINHNLDRYALLGWLIFLCKRLRKKKFKSNGINHHTFNFSANIN